MRKITGMRRVASHTGESGGKPPHSTSFPDDSSSVTEKKALWNSDLHPVFHPSPFTLFIVSGPTFFSEWKILSFHSV
jgi:hypothetical protein